MKFLIESDILNKLEPNITKAVELIKNNIGKSQIVIRHHADCDGYTGAIAVEQAVNSSLISRRKWFYLKRVSSRAPYYEHRDVFWDISNYLKDVSKDQAPLLILMDHGSTTQSLFAIKLAKLYGLKVIVIDHHKPTMIDGKSVISEHADVFINPYLVGGDSNLTAGMLGVEISRLIKKNPISHLAAISGIGDRAEGKEFDQYLRIAKEKGYTKEFARSLARCVDFEAYYLSGDSKLIHDLLLSDLKEQKIKSFLIENEVKKLEDEAKESLLGLTNISGQGFKIIEINVESLQWGYPSQGKATGLMFRHFENEYNEKILVLGIGESAITIRTNLNNFDVNEIIAQLKEKCKHAAAGGGGHEVAGTIHFVAAAKQDVLNAIKDHAK